MKKTTIKEYLKGKIPEDLIELVNRSFEVIGDIAIIEISNSKLNKYEKEIGEALLKVNSHIKVVLKKDGIHEGEFRTQNLKHVCGEKRDWTIYLENGIKLKVKPGKVYFSSKLGNERDELANKIKDSSKVLVMFSGCGPYTFNILKKQPNLKKIDSIEINPVGHELAIENLDLNKSLIKKSKEFEKIIEDKKNKGEYISEREIAKVLIKEKVNFFNGDVRKVVNEELSDEKYDHIYMPLPKDAEHFLDVAFKVSKIGTIVHMYDFVHENDFPKLSEDKVLENAKKFGRKIKIIEIRKVGQYSPRKYRVCCDFEILN